MDSGGLPPEINSGWIYSAVGVTVGAASATAAMCGGP